MDQLSYKRTKLVEVLNARLEERVQAREDARAANAVEYALIFSRIGSLVNVPQFVIWLTSELRSIGLDPKEEDFEEAAREQFQLDYDHWDRDADLKKTIRALETAVDDTVEVKVTDTIYSWI